MKNETKIILIAIILFSIVYFSLVIYNQHNKNTEEKQQSKLFNTFVEKDIEYCNIDITRVYFENKKGYVINDLGEPMLINEKYNYDWRIVFHPEEEIVICSYINESRENYETTCKEEYIIQEITLPCAWCVDILNNGTIQDVGLSCLNEDIKKFIR